MKAFSSEEKQESEPEEIDNPISIVLPIRENNTELRALIPAILSQEYTSEFQLIIVIDKGDHETKDILEQYENDKRLYVTFVPTTSRYMSRQKMAITLGVKAAKYQHVLLIGANTLIEKNSWLQAIGHSFKKDCNLFVVPGTYEESTNSFYQFAHLYTLSYLLNGYLKGRFDRINSNIVGFKKDEFIEQDGFRGGLEHVRGEYEFIVNKYSQQGNCNFQLNCDDWTCEKAPSKAEWMDKELTYMHTKRFLRQSSKYKFIYFLDTFFYHLNYVLQLLLGVWSIYSQDWFLLICVAFCWFLTFIVRGIIAKRAMSFFRVDIPFMLLGWLELRNQYYKLWYTIKYKRSDKTEFTSHKI
ncbi:glycosyltransferase [Hoylesella nanceiensis]|uniref:glycosyltransferase n=1 Tax=Hoylesella nanceiensis TaxID=425941 RepID=UPI0027BA87CD|nr:glycosyltransferase [Hoylesella nanceiensis]